MHNQIKRFYTILVLLCLPGMAFAQQTVRGVVFHDQNNNGEFDRGETGVKDVMVSNGTDIVKTDIYGRYRISVDDNTVLFVIKPQGWTTQVDENNIPQFFSVISSEGASGTKYQGLDPTGSVPETVDFALTKQQERDEFRVVVLGDTQPRDLKEVSYLAHDSIQELIGVDAAFGTTLGDLVFDNLAIHKEMNEAIGQIGIPWRHVIGNHDIERDGPHNMSEKRSDNQDNWDVRGPYTRSFGPSYYAFSWGKAHFVAIDNIRWVDEEDYYYRTGLGEEQMIFIKNFMNEIPEDELVVFMMHIPWVDSTPWLDDNEKQELFDVLASHPNTLSLAAHTHRHFHRFIEEDDGWAGSENHHLVSMGTSCGAWWSGAPDEYGIPHSMMRDGTPTGYAFLDIKGNDYKLTYKAARRPADFQMHLSAPDEVSAADLDTVEVFANVFNALPDATVQMKLSKDGEWTDMELTAQKDPVFEAMRIREHSLVDVPWRKANLTNPDPRHLWKSSLPENIEPGTYTIFVRAEDEWHTYEGRRIIRILP